MFINYYEILGISKDADTEKIKSEYKSHALKWHPDKNPSVDTTIQMQLINEAYLILKNNEARARYDIEYDKYFEFINCKSSKRSASDYEIQDSVLNNWMKNAKNQAISLAKDAIDDINNMAKIGAEEALKSSGNQLLYQIIGGIILVLLGLILSN